MDRILLCSLLLMAALTGQAQTKPDRQAMSQLLLTSLYDSLTHPILDEERVSKIAGVTIVRGGQNVVLSSGTIRFFAPVNKKIFGAVFQGEGTYAVTPATEIERLEFERQTGIKLDSGSHRYQFERAVFWFADTLFDELRKHCEFVHRSVQRAERDGVQRSLKYVTDPSNANSVYRILQEMLEDNPEPYLLAHFIQDREGNDLFLDYDMRRFEEVVISHPFLAASTGFNFWRDPLCSFHVPEEYAGSTEYELCQEEKRRIDVISDTIALNLERGPKVEGEASLCFRPLGDAPASAEFFLDPALHVRSVTTASGKPLAFLRNEKSWGMLVCLPQHDSLNDIIKFTYDGDFIRMGRYFVEVPRRGTLSAGKVIDLQQDRMQPLSTTGWYPQTSFLNSSYFDLTYRFPSDLVIVSAGKKITDTVSAGRRIVRYTTKKPSKIVSFSIGEFKEQDVQLNKDEPPVRIFDISGGDPLRVAVDLSNCVHFFTSMFGKIRYDEMKVTSGPHGGGQAFPEFIQVPWSEEKVEGKNLSVSIDRAHEIAHAWWGHGVGWRSYHDQWLSEGFAEYSALLYALYVLKQDQPFFEKLKRWREEITSARKYALGSGPAAGSIWLGYRSSSDKTPDDPSLLIYKKSAWVLHMLRMMMMDLQTFKENAFRSMMADFYTSFEDLNPGTIDFQHIVEKYTRVNMSWFFHEWVYRNEIPTYKVTHTFTQEDQKKWIVNVSVTQSGVQDSFKMFVPIQIKLKDGTSAFSRMFFNQPVNTFRYELDREPDTIVFNPFESVLCTVEE